MTDLIVGLVSLLGAIFLGIAWGGRKANQRRDAKDAKRHNQTLKRSTEARDAVDDLSDDAVLDRLRKRSRK